MANETLGGIERLSFMPDRIDTEPQGDRIGGQYYYDVDFVGGSISNVTLTDVIINGVATERNERIVTDAGDVTVQSDDYVITMNKTVGEITTITLPSSPTTSRSLIIKDDKGDAATYNITIDGNGKDIDGDSAYILNQDYQALEIIYNGTQWNKIGQSIPAGTGTVTSVALSGGTTGLSVSGSPITSAGTITLSGILVGANGGTGIDNTGKTITLGGNFATSGANAVTLTTTGATNVTLPTSGTLYGTAAGSITSAQLASSMTNETGSGSLVFATSPTLVTPEIGIATGTSLDVSGVLESGANSGTGGQLKMFGSTSGDVTVKVAAAAGTSTVFQLPADNGTNAYVLQTNGSGVTSWVPQSGGGGGSPAGSDTDVQFNDSGSFGASDSFRWMTTSASYADNSLVIGSAISYGDATDTPGIIYTVDSGYICISSTDDAVLIMDAFGGRWDDVSGNTVLFLGPAASGNSSYITLAEDSDNGNSSVKIAAPSSLAADINFVLPADEGTVDYVLSTDGSGNTSWVPQSGGGSSAFNDITSGTNTTAAMVVGTGATLGVSGSGTIVATSVIAVDAAGDTTTFPLLAGAATGSTGPLTDAGLTYNATTNALTTTTFIGALTGNSDTITVANEATDTTCFVGFYTAASGSLAGKTNTNMTFNSNTGVATFASSVLTTTDINGGTVDGTVIGGSSAAAITGTTVTGNSFIPNNSSVPSNGLYLPAANTLGWAINSAAEMQLTSTALSPAVDGGNSLGTTALGWQNLFGNTGFVFNIENGDWVATHTTGILTVGTGDLRITNAGTNSASAVTVGGTQTLTAKSLTSPTITTASLSGTQLMQENASIGMDPSLSADGTWTGITMTATAGYTQAFGDLVYLDPTDSRWEAADANAASGADGDARGMLGMVVVAGTDGNACTVLLQGVIRADAKFPSFTVNNPIYVSETAGSVTQTQPTTTDVVIRIVGAALTADAMWFNPDWAWITHT